MLVILQPIIDVIRRLARLETPEEKQARKYHRLKNRYTITENTKTGEFFPTFDCDWLYRTYSGGQREVVKFHSLYDAQRYIERQLNNTLQTHFVVHKL